MTPNKKKPNVDVFPPCNWENRAKLASRSAVVTLVQFSVKPEEQLYVQSSQNPLTNPPHPTPPHHSPSHSREDSSV